MRGRAGGRWPGGAQQARQGCVMCVGSITTAGRRGGKQRKHGVETSGASHLGCQPLTGPPQEGAGDPRASCVCSWGWWLPRFDMLLGLGPTPRPASSMAGHRAAAGRRGERRGCPAWRRWPAQGVGTQPSTRWTAASEHVGSHSAEPATLSPPPAAAPSSRPASSSGLEGTHSSEARPRCCGSWPAGLGVLAAARPGLPRGAAAGADGQERLPVQAQSVCVLQACQGAGALWALFISHQ